MMSNFSRVGAKKVAAVVVDDFDLFAVDRVRVLAGDPVDDVVILLAEHGRDDRRHKRLDVADDDALDVGVDDEGAGRDARAAGDDQDRLGLLVQERRDVPEHPLEPHVGGQGGRLNLARAVEAPDALRRHGDGDRDVRPLADIRAKDLGRRAPRGRP